MEEEENHFNNSYREELYAQSSYANGAFYDDEQDTFVAGTSPPSSPRESELNVMVWINEIKYRMD